MSVLAVLLIAVATSDLCRRSRFPSWLPLLAGPLAVLLFGLLAGLAAAAEIVLLVLAAAVAFGWALLVDRSRRRGVAEHWPLAVLLTGVLAMLLLGGLAGPADGLVERWLRTVGWRPTVGLSADRFLLILGLFGFQLSTANELVRQVLAAVGAIKPHGEPQASDQLRGGRLLGPMERLLILGLGLAGQITAASLVIAAKSLIRFPELNARRGSTSSVTAVGIDEVTEYFLVGSFVSWLIALIGLGGAHLI
ncbi:hypothetical protein [Microlunatus soli]|uniref:Uncharacterized protein n=1 Tax=Microlunatus soli TaxID=630515 RepID=A0A1H2APF9_9ACTN|nr:hypothetical protein [Microlunatus soli]SDT47820.1 hypothetical protein SAMN04489812_6117 [Microlunatus soli]